MIKRKEDEKYIKGGEIKNHKGERCQFDDNVFCQEGYCEDCAIGEKYKEEFVKK